MSDETSTGGESVTLDRPMKDVANDIESILYGSKEEPVDAELEDVSEDDDLPVEDDDLPEDDDADDKDEGSQDLDDIAELSLADYLGVDDERIVEDEEGKLLFKAIIDGETKQVPLSDLAANFQFQSHINNKSIALENDRKNFDSAREKAAIELRTRIDGITALQKAAEEQLIGEYNAIDWQRLRTEDPANWTALRQEYAEKAQQVQEAQKLAQQESHRIIQEQKDQYEKQMEAHIQKEFDMMVDQNPSWNDPEILKKDMTEIRDFVLGTYGYSEAEFENVNDHRLINLVRDAMAYRNGKKSVEQKKVKRVPKFTKPGAARGNAASLEKARRVKAQKAQLKKSGGSTQSVANALLDRM